MGAAVAAVACSILRSYPPAIRVSSTIVLDAPGCAQYIAYRDGARSAGGPGPASARPARRSRADAEGAGASLRALAPLPGPGGVGAGQHLGPQAGGPGPRAGNHGLGAAEPVGRARGLGCRSCR